MQPDTYVYCIYYGHDIYCFGHNVANTGAVGSPKTERGRKLQRRFQTDVRKLVLEREGGSPEERRVP